MNTKYKIDIAIVSISLLSLMFLVGYSQPLIIAPLDDFRTLNTEILFSIDKADRLIIDDNVLFSTPEIYEVYDGLKLDLEPGKYYWKVVGIGESDIRTLVIESVVNLELVEEDDSYSVVNVGNIGLKVDTYNGEELIGTEDLKKGEKVGLFGNKIKGEQSG